MADAMARFILTAQNKTQMGFAQASAGLSELQDRTKKFNAIAGQMKGLVAGGMIGGLVRSVISAGDEIGDLADKTGFGVESIQSLKIVAADAGIRIDRLTSSIANLEGKMVEASVEGGEKLAAAFAKLGVTAEMLASGNTETVFEQIAISLGQNAGNAQIAAAAHDVLGSSVEKLGPLFKAAAGGMVALNDEMKRNGEIMSQNQVDRLSKADRTLTKFGNRAKVGAASLIEEVSASAAFFKAGMTDDSGKFMPGRAALTAFASMRGLSDFLPWAEKQGDAYVNETSQRAELRPFRPVVPPMLRPESANGGMPDITINVLEQINRGIEKLNQQLTRNLVPAIGT